MATYGAFARPGVPMTLPLTVTRAVPPVASSIPTLSSPTNCLPSPARRSWSNTTVPSAVTVRCTATVAVTATITRVSSGWPVGGGVGPAAGGAERLADKLLVGAPVVTLVALDRFPLWAAVVILVREVAIVLLRVWLGTRGAGMPARPLAKAKTFTQLTAIFLYILPLPSAWDGARLAVLVAATLLTAVTGVDYAVRARSLLRGTPA